MTLTRWCLCALLALTATTTPAQTVEQTVQAGPWMARPVSPGIIVKVGRFTNLFNSRQVVCVSEIDMNAPGIGFRIPFYQNGTRRVVPEMAGLVSDSRVAVNGNFFNSVGSVQHLKINTFVVTQTNPDIQDEGGIAINSAGDLLAMARPPSGWGSLSEPTVMATNVPVVINGAPYPLPNEAFYTTDRHPRTVIGTTAANKALMVVVDGRQSGVAAGMTYVELAQLMKALNCTNAVNMDGGGSSTMWAYGGPNGAAGEVVNVPSNTGGTMRAVPNAVVVTGPAQTSLVEAWELY